MKSRLRGTIAFILALCMSAQVYSQLSDVHYLPPLKQRNAAFVQQAIIFRHPRPQHSLLMYIRVRQQHRWPRFPYLRLPELPTTRATAIITLHYLPAQIQVLFKVIIPTVALSIVVQLEDNAGITLKDMEGKTFVSRQLARGKHKIDIQYLAPGMYLLVSGKEVHRFVKR